jgi:hypothetical protein
MALMHEGAVLVTPELAILGNRRIDPGAIDACFVAAHAEHAQRLGNILFVNLAVAAALYFFVPIQIGLWEPKFYLGVGLFGLLAAVVLDDVRRSNALTAHRLMVITGDQVDVAFVTADPLFAKRVETAMRKAMALRASKASA